MFVIIAIWVIVCFIVSYCIKEMSYVQDAAEKRAIIELIIFIIARFSAAL
jgi:hypothetical protein